MSRAADLLVSCLQQQGVQRIYCVPGESYLPVLDALRDSPLQLVTARQEGGAAMMAEAEGKLTGRPGVCFVTRAPGACNATAGVHVAQQDSTPMVLFVGLVQRSYRGRDAFQEFELPGLFGMAKWCHTIDTAKRIPEIISHAWHLAMSGRPGPVVLGLPQDILSEVVTSEAAPRALAPQPAPGISDLNRISLLLEKAERPFVILGGSHWSAAAVEQMKRFAESWNLPVACSFRRQMLFDHDHPCYAGDVGLGINPKLRQRIEESDLLLLLGGRLSENPSQGFSLLDIPSPQMELVHVHPDANELGSIYHPGLAITATPASLLELLPFGPGLLRKRTKAIHQEYLEWSGNPPDNAGELQMREVMQWMNASLPDDAIVCNGAGNYAIWLHRFYRYRGFATQLAPTSGSMGYGLPAAIAASQVHPDRMVVAWAGDGCFQMTLQEFATAVQLKARLVVMVIDNGIYGTIRMHQERQFPGRISGTEMSRCDFAAIARGFGGYGEQVTSADQLAPAFERARASGLPALLQLKLDAQALAPGFNL